VWRTDGQFICISIQQPRVKTETQTVHTCTQRDIECGITGGDKRRIWNLLTAILVYSLCNLHLLDKATDLLEKISRVRPKYFAQKISQRNCDQLISNSSSFQLRWTVCPYGPYSPYGQNSDKPKRITQSHELEISNQCLWYNSNEVFNKSDRCTSCQQFLPRDAMQARGLSRHAMSVSVSVTFVDCVKTNKHIFHPSIHVYFSEKSNQKYGTYISTIKIWVVQQDTVVY